MPTRTAPKNINWFNTGNHPRGDKFASKLSTIIDVIIRTLYTHSLPPQAEENLAILAVGGYGRKELSPQSDIDLLFLHKSGQDKNIRPLLDRILYPLWDSGLKIGHGVHSPESAIAFCTNDMIARTAYLENRLVIGQQEIFDEFQTGFKKLRKNSSKEFINAKLDELESRHDISKQSRFLVEPDIKEGKGGLRDLHMIGWLYHYVYGQPIDKDGKNKPVLSKDDLAAFNKSKKFLTTLRAHLHLIRGSDDNRLTFDVQPELAERLGYVAKRGMSPAERLMKHYFITATETGRLIRVFCARLEEKNNKRFPQLPRGVPRRLLSDEVSGKPNIRIHTGRLDFARPSHARKKPLDWFRLIRAFSRQTKIDIHPEALTLIKSHLNVMSKAERDREDIALLFKAIILQSKDPIKTMRIMSETGLLQKFIPSFGKISGRIIYGLYRRFTLDEQSLYALKELRQIHHGREKIEHPICTKIIKDNKNLYPFYLSVLFHELIWTIKDRDIKAAEHFIKKIALRLGLSEADARNVGWVSANRTLMIDTIERRTLAEPRAIEQFCDDLPTRLALDLLLVVTVCHLKIVGVHSWDKRMRRRLQLLYELAETWFSGGEEAVISRQTERNEETQKLIESELSNWSDADKKKLFDSLEPQALHSVDPELWGRFAPLMQRANREDLNGAVSVSLRNDGTIEAIVYGNDHDGLLSHLAGAIAQTGLSVRSVQALTTNDNKVIDIFVLQSIDGSPITDETRTKRIHETLLSTIREAPKTRLKISKRLGDRRNIFDVASSVKFDLEASDECLVVEALGLDRPGLLYQLTDALLDIGVIIRSAHVATYGERAVDSFYLQDAPGYKITNKRRIQSIERRLLHVLNLETSQ